MNRLVFAIAALSIASPSLAQTITVTTGEDEMDFTGAQRVENLPGPDGLVSVREAITAANNTDGPQTINFAIPRDRWWNLFPNHAGCRIENGLFITAPDTTIDCTTQTALTGDTNPDGWEVAFFYAGPPSNISQFMVLTDRTTIKGLDYVGGNAFGAGVRFYGSDNRLISCTDGSTTVTSDAAAGLAPFDVTLSAIVPVGAFVTSTATRDSTADTSEFSACTPVTGSACAADFNHDDTVNSQDFFDFLTAFFEGC
jgi:hypothetical protein